MEVDAILPEAIKTVGNFYTQNPNGIVIIRGATATGKSRLSILLAEHFPSEIISADSRQIFREMDIGTDKISKDIREKIPHHQIDIVNPDESYTAGQWKEAAQKQILEIQSRGKLPIIVGGTGLYIDTLYKNFSMPESAPNREIRDKLEAEEKAEPGILWKRLNDIDPEEAAKHHPNSVRYIIRALEIFETTGKTKTEGFFQKDVDQPILLMGLRREKEETNRRINARIKTMFTSGLLEEIQGLLDKGYKPELQSMQGIGYKEIIGYLKGEYDQEKSEELLKRNTHHLAKKQRTRFRRYIAEGKVSPKKNVEYVMYYLG
ncbi:MAG: tRNA (adenosine(37)-N6)-dimethylallyltransferase MiaA [Candidatus Absconditabacteria bacterium]